jgi:hypothetical protein
VGSIEPKVGKAGDEVSITSLTGTGFQANATVCLVLGTDKIFADNVNVLQPKKITCIFKLPQASKKGIWDIVVNNPDGQTGTLTKGFEIT